MTDDQPKDHRQVRAGSRTYFVDVEVTAEGQRYLKITESRFKGEGAARERNTIIVFPEYVQAFLEAVTAQAEKAHI